MPPKHPLRRAGVPAGAAAAPAAAARLPAAVAVAAAAAAAEAAGAAAAVAPEAGGAARAADACTSASVGFAAGASASAHAGPESVQVLGSTTVKAATENVYRLFEKYFQAKRVAAQRSCLWDTAEWDADKRAVWVKWHKPTSYRNAQQYFFRLLEDVRDKIKGKWSVVGHPPDYSPGAAIEPGAASVAACASSGASAPDVVAASAAPASADASAESACGVSLGHVFSHGWPALMARMKGYALGAQLGRGRGLLTTPVAHVRAPAGFGVAGRATGAH